MQEEVKTTLGKILLWALGVATLVVTPLWALDPINPVKMLAASGFGSLGIAVVLANRSSLGLRSYKFPVAVLGLFIAWQILSLAFSGAGFLQQIFGSNGRNTGLITYLAFSMLFIVALVVSSKGFLQQFFVGGIIVGLASLGYGVIQAIGADPFDWVNPYSPVFGFLGNPNFQSSLLGILGALVFTYLLGGGAKVSHRAFYVVYLLLTVYVISETNSQQGFLVLLIGSAVSLGVFVAKKNEKLGVGYLALSAIGFLGVLFGTLNKGPLASILYKDSVTYRGDYWRAGWKMTLENPIFGVGLDSYGDWYRRSRTVEATLRRGPDVTSNAAHNVYLDLSSYGGFPLLLAYLALMVLVAISAYKVIKRSQGFNAGFIGIVAAWVAFQAQSIISINQIGLAIWGWVLSGLIIGYEINTRGGEELVDKKKVKKVGKPAQRSATTTVAMFVGLIIGVLVGMPPYMASAKYKGALETSNPEVIQQSAYIWPLDPSRMIQVALTLNENKLEDQGLEVSLDAVEKFPDNYSVWQALNSMNKATAADKERALAEMKRLDPLNPNLK